MAHLQVLALLTVLVVGVLSQADIRKPPIIQNPKTIANLYYSESSKVIVPCVADSIPSSTYLWARNGTVITPSAYITFDSVTGNLSFSSFSTREEGTYICFANANYDNGQGGQITAVSWSAPVNMFQSRIEKFGSDTETITKQVTEYDYVFLACGSKKVVGSVIIFNWYFSTRTSIDTSDNRLFIDQKGNLHFTYVLAKDAVQDGYMCGIGSDREQIIQLGTKNLLTVNPRSLVVAVKPQLQYSNSGVKGLLYSTVRLECAFSGFDPVPPHIPQIEWSHDSNEKILSNNKYTFYSYNRILEIRNVTENDEKYYFCTAMNSAGETKASVLLNVTSLPLFVNGAPRDQTVPEGANVQFSCDARSASRENPPSPPVWAINGNKMGPQNNPNKFQLSNDNKILSILNVKKATDILCVQCEVTNDMGTVLANACLNVLLATTVVTQPSLIQKIKFGGNVDLTITATTDASMTLSYRWEFKNRSYVGSDHPPHMYYNPNTNLAYINTSKLTSEQYGDIGGVYRRVIYHLYQTIYVDIEVILEDRYAASRAGAGIDPWIIGLIIALILLLIIILIIIYVICRKKQEGDYNVDKKETGAGLDPEKELKEKDFNAFSRPEYNTEHYNYPDSKPPGGDPEFDDTIIGDDESLGEYGKEDITHFNEDGSFIGIYQSKQQPPAQPHESTI